MSFCGGVFRALGWLVGLLLLVGEFTFGGSEASGWTRLAGVDILALWIFDMVRWYQAEQPGY